MKTEDFLKGTETPAFARHGIRYDAMNPLQPVVDGLRQDLKATLVALDNVEKVLRAHFATPETREGRLALAAMNEARAAIAKAKGQ